MKKTIEFKSTDQLLILVYSPRYGADWLHDKLENGSHTIKDTFTVKKKDIFKVEKSDNEVYEISFKIAKLRESFWVFNKDILDIEYDLKIHQSIKLGGQYFTSVRNKSIFRKIGDLITSESLTIGGHHYGDACLSEAEYRNIITGLPSTYEIDKYINARIASVLKEKFEMISDYESSYHKYLNKKLSKSIKTPLFNRINEYEIIKYRDLQLHLNAMLEDENGYSEKAWQNEIIKFILLLFPKYIYAFTEAPVLDSQHDKVRALDFLLVDSSGNIDIVEIKKPFEKSLVTHSGYRDNYIPLRELSGTIMQIEKYIFHLMRSGRKGEKLFNEKYKDSMHDGFKIHISNPKGMIISGRTNNLSENQLKDLEIIKRKYQNIVDILSYDDLLGRLGHTINKFQNGI